METNKVNKPIVYSVIDLETTGLDFKKEGITEIAIVQVNENFEEIGSFHSYVATEHNVSEFITGLTGITNEKLAKYGRPLDEVKEVVKGMIEDTIVVAQHAPFDLAFLREIWAVPDNFYCTRSLTNVVEPEESASLIPTCERLGIKLENAHTAMADARATVELFKYRMQVDGLAKYKNMITVSHDRMVNFIPAATDQIYLKGQMDKPMFELSGRHKNGVY